MKYSAHKINIRTINNMVYNTPLMVKHGKKVQYKGGYNVVHAFDNTPVFNSKEIMEVIKKNAALPKGAIRRHQVAVITKHDNKLYSFQLAMHFSTKQQAIDYLGENADFFSIIEI